MSLFLHWWCILPTSALNKWIRDNFITQRPLKGRYIVLYWPFIAANKAYGLEGVEYHIWGVLVQYICLFGCKIQPVDVYVSVCLVLTIDVYAHVLPLNHRALCYPISQKVIAANSFYFWPESFSLIRLFAFVANLAKKLFAL